MNDLPVPCPIVTRLRRRGSHSPTIPSPLSCCVHFVQRQRIGHVILPHHNSSISLPYNARVVQSTRPYFYCPSNVRLSWSADYSHFLQRAPRSIFNVLTRPTNVSPPPTSPTLPHPLLTTSPKQPTPLTDLSKAPACASQRRRHSHPPEPAKARPPPPPRTPSRVCPGLRTV